MSSASDLTPAEHSLQVLEYHAVLSQLAAHAMSESGTARLHALAPGRETGVSEVDQILARACMALFHDGTPPRAARFPEPRDWLTQAAPSGAVLELEAFQGLREFLIAAAEVHTWLGSDTAAPYPAFADLALEVSPCAALAAAIARVFDDRGEVRDNASPRLAGIRHEMITLERRIRRKLEALLRDATLADALQEQYVAVRHNRYVIPVRRESRGLVNGVVHDQSNTGRTLFMEPAAVLDDANDLTAARLEERDEIRRILAALSEDVRRAAPEVRQSADGMARFDLAVAIGAWARAYDCHYLPTGDALRLDNARHPLLQAQLRAEGRGDALVPLRVALSPTTRVMVVTGPNTGGKTVVLKTIGLLLLLGRSGLPAPAAPTSVLPPLDSVLADIGDEQSIAQSLSTFSGHIRQVAAILDAAGPATLVLLDELGAGTDPLEGGALGCAVLRRLANSGATTLATTHLGVIKHYVHEEPGMENACVRFNQDTLAPEYVLDLGRPGSSFALSIAERLGLPPDVLASARDMLGNDRIRLESLLAEMDEQQQALGVQLAEAGAARDRAVAEREAVRQELDRLREERRTLLRQAQAEATSMVDRTRRQMETLLTRAAREEMADDEVKALRREVEQKKDRLNKGLETTRPKPKEAVVPATLEVGARVWVPAFQDRGTIVELNRDRTRATVNVNGLKLQVDVKDLGKPSGDEPIKLDRSGPGRGGSTGDRRDSKDAGRDSGSSDGRGATPNVRISKPLRTRAATIELNLIGERVEAALAKLDDFLDDAIMANLTELRVVHGFGTGALRVAIHENLSTHPLVERFAVGRPDRDAGGGGVTHIQLRS